MAVDKLTVGFSLHSILLFELNRDWMMLKHR